MAARDAVHRKGAGDGACRGERIGLRLQLIGIAPMRIVQ